MTRRKRLLAVVAIIATPFLIWLAVLGFQISTAGVETSSRKADVAIVLGAGLKNGQLSPVFEERIRHGVTLFKSGRVKHLLLTGGHGESGGEAESVVARRRAIEWGVPASAILIEDRSRTTQQNFVEARRVMAKHGAKTAIVVSDPLHMKRALRMGVDLGINVSGSPTPTTRFRSLWPKTKSLVREVICYNLYLLFGI